MRDQIGSTLDAGDDELVPSFNSGASDVVLVAMDQATAWVDYIVHSSAYKSFVAYHTFEMVANSAWYTSLEPGQIWITTQQYSEPLLAAAGKALSASGDVVVASGQVIAGAAMAHPGFAVIIAGATVAGGYVLYHYDMKTIVKAGKDAIDTIERIIRNVGSGAGLGLAILGVGYIVNQTGLPALSSTSSRKRKKRKSLK
jgi:hypothetical protein